MRDRQPARARANTMADVARLAGVTKMTVSRVLSGSTRVSRETANRVHAAVQALNYQPNELARSLRAVHTRTIAVIVPYLYDPFFASCAHAVSTVAGEHGYSVLVTTSNENAETEQKQISLMLRRRVDGLVLIPAPDNTGYLRADTFSRLPVVTVDRPARNSRMDSVLVDNIAGAKGLVNHLIGHGHRRIAFLGHGSTLHTMKTRYRGYRNAMIAAGLSPAEFRDCLSFEDALTFVRSLQTSVKPPTAVFVANNLAMRYLLHALNEQQISIPQQVAIAGFDDFDMADVLQPALTVVRQPAHALGEAAARLLFQRIASGTQPTKGRRIVLPLELVLRRSCGCNAGAVQLIRTHSTR